MNELKVGDRVVSRLTNEEGTVVRILPPSRGRQLIKVCYPSREKDELSCNLRPCYDERDPFARCSNGVFASYAAFALKNTSFKIRNSNNATISTLKASKTMFKPYQFKPLLKFLNSPNRRILVADEVGLGKTIEAGHILMELKARRELRNVLIVCPKTLRDKWRDEMRERFSLAFRIYEKVPDLVTDLKGYQPVRAIISYGGIRTCAKEKQAATGNSLVNLIESGQARLSMVICDEAHHMRNDESQTYRVAEKILKSADAVLFLTATPVMISQENLYNLLHLLNPTDYDGYQVFLNLLAENRPFVEALRQVPSAPFKKILSDLTQARVRAVYTTEDEEQQLFYKVETIDCLFEHDPVYAEIKRLLCAEETMAHRARLQYLLTTMNVMNTTFSRTRKREVTTDMSQATREPHLCSVVLSGEEKAVFDKVMNTYRLYDTGMDIVQRKRQVASSVWAYCGRGGDMDNYLDKPDAKMDMLLAIMGEVFKGGVQKIVVFAFFKDTLRYLQKRLQRQGIDALLIYGDVKHSERMALIEKFRKEPSAKVLLASEVGSEGIDLQFCNAIVNYDLPWNPMVVEQRIGRVDRIGQKAKVVNIYNLVVKGSIQEEIYHLLLDRIGIFKSVVGDMEAILEAPMKKGDKEVSIQEIIKGMRDDFYKTELTEQEREARIREVAQAIENERQTSERLEEGLKDTLTNDAYFKDQIRHILRHNAYVTEAELRKYVETTLRKCLPDCQLVDEGDHVWLFRIPPHKPAALGNFLAQYGNNTEGEFEQSLRRFRALTDGKTEFHLTFSQEKAYEQPQLHFINLYHPLIQACLRALAENGDAHDTTFCFALPANEVLQKGERYFMGIYQIDTIQEIQGQQKTNAQLLPVVYNLQEDKLEERKDRVEQLSMLMQEEGVEHALGNDDFTEGQVLNMRIDFAEYVGNELNRQKDEISRQLESKNQRNKKQAVDYFNSRIRLSQKYLQEEKQKLENAPSTGEDINLIGGRIKNWEEKIQKYQRKLDERLQEIDASKAPCFNDKLLSVSLITIV